MELRRHGKSSPRCPKQASWISESSKTTLFRQAKLGEISSKPMKARMGRKTILSPALEEQLVEYLLEIEKKFFGLTRRDVSVMACQSEWIDELAGKLRNSRTKMGETFPKQT